MEYRQLLNHHRLKATPQRLAILQIMEHAGHISMEDLFAKIRQIFANVSLATLYKNIHTMMETGMVREVKISGLKTRYEIAKAPHAHIVCKECRSLQDISVDFSQLSLDNIIREYEPEEVSITLSALCPQCRQNYSKQ